MSSVSKVIITIVIVVVVALGGWWLFSSMSNTNNSSNGQSQNTNEANDAEAAVTITYDGTGFVPASTKVAVGEVIKITNNSQNSLYFASDEHPIHLNNTELNVGDIGPGNSATFTISDTGTWTYHDHYNASAGGEIIVE